MLKKGETKQAVFAFIMKSHLMYSWLKDLAQTSVARLAFRRMEILGKGWSTEEVDRFLDVVQALNRVHR